MAQSTPLRQHSEDSCASVVSWFRKEACVSFDGKTAECLSLSENWKQLTGYAQEYCIGKHFLPLLRKTDQYKFLKFLAYPMLEKPVKFMLEHADGGWEWFQIADFMVSAEDNIITLLIHHITDDVQRENALHKATQEAELALRGQSEFFAHISHELRTPLNAILGFAQMMQQGTFGEITNPRYQDYLEIMNHSGQELLGKINDLLEISSLCAGIDQLNEKAISLQDLVSNVVDIHTRELFFRHIQVHVDIPAVMLRGDRIKLQQALSHLLKNSLKFSPDYSSIFLSGKLTAEGGFTLVMIDQGRGFTEEQLAHFYQRRRHFSFLERNRKLLGFGLPLAEELIRLHDGNLQCRNAAEGGAEVLLTLPPHRVIAAMPEEIAPTKQYSKIRNTTLASSKHSAAPRTKKPSAARTSQPAMDYLQEPWLA